MPEPTRSLFYWHSEGLSATAGSANKGICVNSANLIDFMASVGELANPSVISGPIIKWNGKLTIPNHADVKIENGKLRLMGKIPLLTSIPGFLFSLLFGELFKHIKGSSITVSVGLSGTGTMVGIVRALLCNRKHAFIVRGDRLVTVSNSSRSFFNKKFVKARIHAYNWLMLRLVRSNRSEIWFQGRGHYEKLLALLPADCSSRIHVLDAVLRKLPTSNTSSQKKYDLIFTGRITVEKGLIELVEALQILSQSGLKLTLCVVGEGPDKSKIIEAAKKAKVADQIHWQGFISNASQIVGHLTASRLFVLPSYTEGLPRSLLEAMALGLPCVATPVGGIPFLFSHNESIFLVEPRDSANLAEQIRSTYLAETKDELRPLKDKAKTIAIDCSFENKAIQFYKGACLESAQ